MRLDELYFISYDEERIFNFLREVGVIRSYMSCPTCGKLMTTDNTKNSFRCRRTTIIYRRDQRNLIMKCDSCISIFKDSWFFIKTRVGLKQVFTVIFLFLHHDYYTQSDIAFEARIPIHTVRKIMGKIVDIFDLWMHDCRTTKIGGRNVIVDIDEACFGGKKTSIGS